MVKTFTVNVLVDADQDGVIDEDDPDRDGDGVDNDDDDFPDDPSETTDTDGDGQGDNRDNDDDNDGVEDASDDFPKDDQRSGDTDGDGIDDMVDPDIDGDGISNENDLDADGDGVLDEDAENTAPVAVDDTASADSLEPVQIDVLNNDTDINGDTLTITSATSNQGTVSIDNEMLAFVAPENFTGTLTINYSITDGNEGTDNAKVVVAVDTFDPTTLAPVVSPPQDVQVNATGLFTKVDLGVASAVDSNGNPLPVSLVDGITFFEPGINTAYWKAIDESGNETVSSQEVLVRPLVSFAKDQTITEGETGVISVHLNGEAPEYPFTLDYIVDFSVNDSTNFDDHSLRSGSITFESGTQADIVFTTLADGIAEADEKIVVRFSGEINTTNDIEHTVTLTENNAQPVLSIIARQQGEQRLTVSQSGGDVSILSQVEGNEGESYMYTWTASEALADTDSVAKYYTFSPQDLAMGVYSINLLVESDDPNTPDVTASLDINVVEQLASLSAQQDSDGDQIPDDQEGYKDEDGDGIADFKDSITERNVIPELGSNENAFLVEAEAGVSLRIGNRSIVSGEGGALINVDDVEQEDMAADNVGGLFDFEIRELPIEGQSVMVVLPQQRAIPFAALYRKYSEENGWRDFVIDGANEVYSTAGEIGYCPPPSMDVWTVGLSEGDFCVRLTIEDGGPNDADATVNGTIVDPGGVAIEAVLNTPPQAQNDALRMLFNTTASIDVLENDIDSDGDTLTIVQANSDFGDVMVEGAQLYFTPIDDYFGDVKIRYSVDDGFGVLSSAEVNVSIFVNTAPITVDDAAQTDDETSILVNVLANDTDQENDSLTLTDVTSTIGTVVIEDQQVRFTPTLNAVGDVSVTYSVRDELGLVSQGNLVVTVVAATQLVTVDNSQNSGGSMHIVWLMLLSLCVAIRRCKLKAKMLMSVVILGAACSANAQSDETNDSPWSVSVAVGNYESDVSREELLINTSRQSEELIEFDNQDRGYHLAVRYDITQHFLIEAGYRDMGYLKNFWSSQTSEPQEFIDAVQPSLPVLGSGAYLKGGIQVNFGRWYTNAYLGIQQYRQSVTSIANADGLIQTSKPNKYDSAGFVGFETGWEFSETWSVGLQVETFAISQGDVSANSIVVRYSF